MLKSLRNLEILIPFRGASAERLANLITLLKYLNNTHSDYTVIVLESDVAPTFKWSDVGDPKVTHYFQADSGPFNKALMCNLGAKMSRAEVICINDADCIAHPDIFSHVTYQIQQPEFDNTFLSPYRECLNISGDYKSVLASTFTFEALGYINRGDLPPGVNELYSRNTGGCLLCRRKDFVRMGGMNTDFEGWGGEDSEFFHRTRKLGIHWISFDYALYHLHHDSPVRNQYLEDEKNRHNLDLFAKIEKMTESEMQAITDKLSVFFA